MIYGTCWGNFHSKQTKSLFSRPFSDGRIISIYIYPRVASYSTPRPVLCTSEYKQIAYTWYRHFGFCLSTILQQLRYSSKAIVAQLVEQTSLPLLFTASTLCPLLFRASMPGGVRTSNNNPSGLQSTAILYYYYTAVPGTRYMQLLYYIIRSTCTCVMQPKKSTQICFLRWASALLNT